MFLGQMRGSKEHFSTKQALCHLTPRPRIFHQGLSGIFPRSAQHPLCTREQEQPPATHPKEMRAVVRKMGNI